MLSGGTAARSSASTRTGEHMDYDPGAFCWVGLASSDPDGAKAFYESLFEWQNEDLRAGQFGTCTSLRRDGSEVAILYRQTREARAARAAPHWTPYISVEDADASALRTRELGGALLREPLDLGDAGRVVALRDPVGAIFSLWQPRSHSGAELVNDLGALCWHELVTLDLDRAESFYNKLLGWEYETDSSGSTTVTNAASPIATIRERREEDDASASSWIPSFGVQSVQSTQQTAAQSGGRALTAPADSPIGRTAVLADQQGATFAVLEQPARER